RWSPLGAPTSAPTPESAPLAGVSTRHGPVRWRGLTTTVLTTKTTKRPSDDLRRAVSAGSGGRIRTYDLWVMSPASYRAAPPRGGGVLPPSCCCENYSTPP